MSRICERVIELDPADLLIQRALGISHGWLADLAEREGDHATAAEHWARAAEVLDQLVHQAPDVVQWREDLETIRFRLARVRRSP